MKPLFWNKIVLSPEEIKNKQVIWAKLKDAPINKKAFEKMFCVKSKKASRGQSKRSDKKKAGPSEPTGAIKSVVSTKTSNAVGILLSSLPDLSVLKDILLEMDDLMLNETQISGMINNLPSKEELKKIKEADVPGVNWDKPERYFVLLAQVPNYEYRLKTWLYELKLQEQSNSIRKLLGEQLCASDALLNCEAIVRVFELILACGNYMNGGTAKGQADGFDLETLVKLSGTKNSLNTGNLLSFISRTAKKRYPEEIDRFGAEMEPVLHISEGITLKEIQTMLGKLLGDFKSIEMGAKDIQISAANDNLQERASSFVFEAKDELEKLSALERKTIEKFNGVLSYFGAEDFDVNNSNELYAFFGGFYRDLKASLPVETKAVKKKKKILKKVKDKLTGARKKKSGKESKSEAKKAVKVVRKIKRKKVKEAVSIKEVVEEAAERRRDVKVTSDDVLERERDMAAKKESQIKEKEEGEWDEV